MSKSEFVWENVMHKLIWDFEILTDHLISDRRLHLMIVNKKKNSNQIVDLAVLAHQRV